jgi:hypothetical protein
LPDERGRLIGLDELLGQGPVAISFNRDFWCLYCRLNTDALARAQEEFGENGGRIVAITPDRQKFNSDLRADAKAPFPILTDMDNGYAMSLDLAICGPGARSSRSCARGQARDSSRKEPVNGSRLMLREMVTATEACSPAAIVRAMALAALALS